MNHVPERIPDVVTEVARRLIDIRRFAQAAELYEGIDAHREAINVYIAGGLWDQAKQLARSAAPQFAAEVEAAHKAHMQQSGAAADLVHTGNVAEGIEAYAQQNEWDRARELAQQQGPAMLLKCATLHDRVTPQAPRLTHPTSPSCTGTRRSTAPTSFSPTSTPTPPRSSPRTARRRRAPTWQCTAASPRRCSRRARAAAPTAA